MSQTSDTLTIAVMNTKGGTTKTTTTMLLAHALNTAGRSVEVWDADPQRSATEWVEDATQAHGGPLPIQFQTMNRASLSRRSTAADVLLIDTPPGDPGTQSAAAGRADLVIVPAEPAPMEVSRVWATVDALGQSVPAVVLLARVDSRTTLLAETIEALDDEGVPHFATTIPARTDYKRMLGTWPTATSRRTAELLVPWAQLAAEIEEMIAE